MAFLTTYCSDAEAAEAAMLRKNGELDIRQAADKAYADAIACGKSTEEAQAIYDEVYSCVSCL